MCALTRAHFSFFVFLSSSHTMLCPAAGSNGQLPKPAKPTKPRIVQMHLTPKVAMAEVATDSSYVTASPVLPELTADNAATRYVFVPAHEFSAEGIGGWVARCALPPSSTQQHPHGREQVAHDRATSSPILPCTLHARSCRKPTGH